MQEPSALSSQSCQASDCHRIKMFHRLDQICELQWLSEERQIWLVPMAGGSCIGWSNQKPFNKDEQNDRFFWPTFLLILMLGILKGGRFCAFTCPTWNFLIWKQQNLHIKENDQHLVQLLLNKLATPFITVLLISINAFGKFFNVVSFKKYKSPSIPYCFGHLSVALSLLLCASYVINALLQITSLTRGLDIVSRLNYCFYRGENTWSHFE